MSSALSRQRPWLRFFIIGLLVLLSGFVSVIDLAQAMPNSTDRSIAQRPHQSVAAGFDNFTSPLFVSNARASVKNSDQFCDLYNRKCGDQDSVNQLNQSGELELFCKVYANRCGIEILPLVSLEAEAEAAEDFEPPLEKSQGTFNSDIVHAAWRDYGMATNWPGTDNGVNACMASIQKVLRDADVDPLANGTYYLPTAQKALANGRGKLIAISEVQLGDLAIAAGTASGGGYHIGIVTGENEVTSNSSSRAHWNWISDLDFDGYYRRFGSTLIYRIQN